MAEFNVRADAVDVEQIMRQIRARIREKQGVDYTEDQIQELARVRLEKFLDPKGVRSDLLEQFRRSALTDVPPIYDFDDQTLFRSGNPLVAFIRRLLKPILKLFFSPNPLIHAMHLQTGINQYLLDRAARDVLFYEVVHNLVVEMTRTSIEVRNAQMRVESIAGRLDFNERRARALEAVVQYRPDAAAERPADRSSAGGPGGQRSEVPTAQAPGGVDPITGGDSLRSRRRRRRRGRRSGPGFAGPAAEAGNHEGEGASFDESPRQEGGPPLGNAPEASEPRRFASDDSRDVGPSNPGVGSSEPGSSSDES
jgi:hypothetical protein